MRSKLCASAVLLLAATACSTDAADKELYLYNWSDFIGTGTIERFEQRTGIKVVYDTYDAEETMDARLLAGESGYDVVSASSNFSGREIKAGVYLPLDKSKLPNWKNLDPRFLAKLESSDPGNRYGVPYMQAVNGFAYNVDMIRARMPDAPVASLDMIFKPEIIRHFADCGVTFLDSPEDVLQLALQYLHLDPNSTRPEDYAAAEKLLLKVRPYVRNFDSIEYMNALANKEVCIAMSWSADYATVMARARAAGAPVHLAFTVPAEGANQTYSSFLIPVGAPHPEAAYAFLNYILDPQVIARITNEIYYGNANRAANAWVRPEILNDHTLYPTPDIEARLYPSKESSITLQRIRTRVWTRIKTGE
ncbi:MAG: polyamine ABC transporter substrate-binding protein [Proteobacteria bacterium]|nr:polyamine ABC transporter substrate-binding protein [Pseudomonadota bacterium]